MISSYDKDTNNKNRWRFDFDYRWIVSWDDCYTWLFELVREWDVPEGTCGLLSSVKKAEEVTGTSLISDYSMLTSTDIFGTTFWFPSSSSCASVSWETSEKCCTSEKKKHKRFKIQDFLNDRNRK